ncbi:hypothetical protein UY3_17194 [Chelonia mydas]|uniref:Uncharacterized protein n=1 Tax=Chelonia mydas TaxID=8469 RepID=M7AKQ6_CHEMY|nr:hypothetical protein UY3_17194 [Chelonia mydas]
MEATLRLQSDPGPNNLAPSMSSSVRSTLAPTAHETGPAKDSKAHRHCHYSGHRASASVRHHSPSPVPVKKKRLVRDRSSSLKPKGLAPSNGVGVLGVVRATVSACTTDDDDALWQSGPANSHGFGTDTLASSGTSSPALAAAQSSSSVQAPQPEYRLPRDPGGAEGSELGPPPVLFSSSSPDEAVEGTSTDPALEDSRVLQQLLRQAAQSLGIQAKEVKEDLDPVIDILAPSGPSRVALPFIKSITETSKNLWQTPVSLAPTAKKSERCYFVPSRAYEHLYTHPPPDSLVVDAANQRERQGFQGSTPKNRDAKKLDLFGRKVYSTGGLQPAGHSKPLRASHLLVYG